MIDLYRTRRGVTLIEMTITIGIGSVVFGLTVTLLASILRSDRTARQHLAETQTIGRLALQFRADAHAAAKAEIIAAADGAGDGLRFVFDDQLQVEYQWNDGKLRRTRSQNGQPSGHEQFVLPTARTSFRIDDADSAEIAILTLEPSGEAPDAPRGRNLQIETRLASPHSKP